MFSPVQVSSSDKIDIQKVAHKIMNVNIIEAPLQVKQVKWILSESLRIFKQQSTVLELESPIKIVGDICGHYTQLMKIFEFVGQPSKKNYLFLGNYVCKGPNSIQTLFTLLFYKIKHPQNVFMLRGRFETAQNNFIFGFYQQCLRKYDNEVWMQIKKVFTYLPLCAVISKKICCVSSGLSSSIQTVFQMSSIVRGSQNSQAKQIMEILTSSPNEKQFTYPDKQNCHKKQISQQFVYEWIRQNDFSLVIRSNSILQNGFRFSCNNLVLTLCSIPNFLNVKNIGAIADVNFNLLCSIQLIKNKI